MRISVSFSENDTTVAVNGNYVDAIVPTASVTKTGKVSTLTVTDKNGTTTTNINDGEGIPDGGTVGQILVKKSLTDGDIEWKDIKTLNGASILGSGDIVTHYTHTQNSPGQIWTINHNLGKYPSVTVVDSADSVVVGDINYISVNSLTVTFQSAFSGKAYLN